MNTEAAIGFKRQVLLVALGALIGLPPVVITTCFQTKAAWDRSIHDQRVAAVRSFSYACTRTVQLAGRLAMLYTVVDRTSRSDQLQRRQLEDFNNLSRDMEDARTNFVAELNLSNALFDTNFPIPVEDAPTPADQTELTRERRRQSLEIIRAAIPIRSLECATITDKLMAKLRG